MASLHNSIQNSYKTAKSYPELVRGLIALGIQTYTVDVATSVILYRSANGEHIIHHGSNDTRNIHPAFNADLVKQAISDNQQGKSDYPGFMNDIAKAGVRFYEATIMGPDKRVTYIGATEYHEEKIPL